MTSPVSEGGVQVLVLVWAGRGERGPGGSDLVQGKLLGSQAEPDLFGGLLTHTPPRQHFLEMSSELRLSLHLTAAPDSGRRLCSVPGWLATSPR